MFIVVDGIDGSGKSTVANTWLDYLSKQNKKIFNLKNYWQENKKHPLPDDLVDYDVLFSAEPTTVWTGAAIREEMITNGNNYSPLAIANAFALDRLILYKRVLLPFLNQNKIVIQDRSVSTSLCYQPLQGDQSLSMEQIAQIEGNTFALEHAPDHLVIADIEATKALARISNRFDKQDNSIFEKANFLTQARAQFLDPEYQQYFTTRGTKIHILNCNEEIDIMKNNSIELLKTIVI